MKNKTTVNGKFARDIPVDVSDTDGPYISKKPKKPIIPEESVTLEEPVVPEKPITPKKPKKPKKKETCDCGPSLSSQVKKEMSEMESVVRYWGDIVQRSMGISNWGVEYMVRYEDEHCPALAYVNYDVLNRAASINMNYRMVEHWGKNEYSLCRVLFHELAHLLVAPLSSKSCGYLTENIDDFMQHDIIRTMENSLFDPLWEARLQNYIVRPARKKIKRK